MATLGEIAVGGSVYLNVNGVRTEFLVVHQGLPSSTLYDASCDGTWLLMKDLYVKRTWDSTDNDYVNSDVHAYLNDTFLDLLDSDVQSCVKQVKIPYLNGTGSDGSVVSGANGLSTKIFLLSAYELGWTSNNDPNFPVDGTCLNYFSGTSIRDSKRSAYYNGTATNWWIRSAYTEYADRLWYVDTTGFFKYTYSITGSYGVRPALILSSLLSVSDDGYVIPNITPTIPSGITTPSSVGYGENIPISWGASTDANGDAITYIVERSIDGGANWNQVYQGADTSVADTFGISVAYRVKAVDTNSSESEYATSSAVELTKGGSGGIFVRQNGAWKPAEAIKIITGGA